MIAIGKMASPKKVKMVITQILSVYITDIHFVNTGFMYALFNHKITAQLVGTQIKLWWKKHGGLYYKMVKIRDTSSDKIFALLILWQTVH